MPSHQPSGMRAFLIVAAGQFVSIVGSAMSQYAITLWSWQFLTQIHPVDDPATSMALVGFFSFAPTVLLSPIAGALVDRWNRKLVMMLVDIAALLASITIFLLYTSNQLQVWHLYVTGAFVAVFRAFQFPAYSASISLMVPKQQYERANAILGLTESVSTIFAPLIAGALLGLTGIIGVLIIDIVSFGAALGTLAIVYIPQPEKTKKNEEEKSSLLKDASYGFRYIFQRPSLLGLQLVFFFGNLLSSVSFTLLAPMILSRTNNDNVTLAAIFSAQGIGAVIGGLILAARGGLKRRVNGVLGGWFLSSIFGSVLLGIGQVLPIWAICAFLSALVGIYINASNQAIWQSKVPPDIQGRVFSARLLIAQVVGPLGVLIAGPLADRVFEPAMREGGSLTGVFGWLVGTGPGAGMALILVIAGLLAACAGASGYLFPAIRNAEDILPDHDQDAAKQNLPEEVPIEAQIPAV